MTEKKLSDDFWRWSRGNMLNDMASQIGRRIEALEAKADKPCENCHCCQCGGILAGDTCFNEGCPENPEVKYKEWKK